MTHTEQINAFKGDIDAVIERYRAEFDLPYASAIGVLGMVAHYLSDEAARTMDNEDEPPPCCEG